MIQKLAPMLIFQKLIPVGFILTCLVSLYFLIQAVLTFLAPSRIIPPAPSHSAPNSAAGVAQAAPELDTQFDAFHRLTPQERVEEPIQEEIGADAPETKLNLVLTGRRANGDGQGSAQLRLPNNTEGLFQQGEEIMKNVRLDAVYDTHIIISQRGRQERVTFIRNERGEGSLISSQETPPPSSAPVLQSGLSKEKLGSTLKDFQAQGITQQDIFRALRPRPVQKNGQIIGYQIRVANDVFDLRELGLKGGDIITHMNGQDLRGDPAQLQGIVQDFITNVGQANLSVLRGGQSIQLSAN